ncbi:sensor histidine kinase [Eisenbergiella tayi]|uniref:Putative sensor-like histidine kinase n=1 Tax=Eisenbergiella tayi TaxID=1432052 RepID=A0A1E3A4U0_9FIRM|nr:histidine kinase [Eisenbergiella tayi]ODM03497.1 putative sensor-like histidine kinase [Eisenbergiella tayi]
MQKEKKTFHKMHFISNVYRFIIFLILLIVTMLILIINYNFSRQNHQYTLDYNMSAVKGLKELIADQEHFFLQQLNNTYESYYAYKEGLFSCLNSSRHESFPYRQNIYRFLNESFPPNSEMSSLTIYAASDNQIYSVTKQVRKNFSASLPEFSPLIECYENPFTVLRVMPSQSSRILETSRGYSFIYCLRDVITKVNIGAIQADYSVSEVQKFLSSNYPGVKGDFLVIDLEGNVLFDTSGSWYDAPFPWAEPFISCKKMDNVLVTLDHEKYYVNMEAHSYPNIRVIGLVSQKTLSADIRKNIALMLLATGSVTALTCIGIYLYLNSSSRQLNLIYFTMLRIQNGELDSYIPVDNKHKNELVDISVSFNDMLRNLNLYIDKVYKTEIENQRYKLKALQSQINPHFLYNTLEAIRMKAVLQEEPEIGEMIYILSKIFRNSIKNESILPVRQEIENCKNYLRLCDIEYKNLFRYHFQVENALLTEPIIQHALLVMIENYIMHGFDSNRTDNYVNVTGCVENGFAVFRVRDNGFGIKTTELEKLRLSFLEKSIDHVERIGLKNIYQRMKLLYGENCDLQILSEYGQGTEIIFSFIYKGESVND